MYNLSNIQPAKSITHYKQLQTGDIIAVSGTAWLSKRIQDFQLLVDPESGKMNHSGLIFMDDDIWVFEADIVEGYKIKAAVKPTLLFKYLVSESELFIFRFKNTYSKKAIKRYMFKYMAVPYEYHNLLGDQIILKLSQWIGKKIGKPDFEIWLGRKNRTTKRLICHEYAQLVWHEFKGIFPDHRKGKISTVVHHPDFEMYEVDKKAVLQSLTE